MNIFHKITLQSMKKNRTRTIVTIIGVILATAMITAVATFIVSLQNYMVQGATLKYGDWHIEIPNVSTSFIDEQRKNEIISNIDSFENIGYVKLNNSKNPNKPYAFISGFKEDTFNSLPINLISGRLPNNNNEILIPTHLSENGGINLSIGDQVSFNIGNRIGSKGKLGQNNPYTSDIKFEQDKEKFIPKVEKQFTIVGICERPTFENFSAPGYTLITKSNEKNQIENYTSFIKLKNPKHIHRYAKDISKNQDYILNNFVLRFMGLSNDSLFNRLLYSIGFILIALIMVGAIFLIYNSFNISMNERTRQFGMLASIGATSKQLKNSVIFEGLCISFIGIPIGIILGIGSINFVISIVSKNFANIFYNNTPLKLKINITTIIIGGIISLITTLISAYIPTKKTVNTSVINNIRQTNEIKVQKKSIQTSKRSKSIYGLESNLALKNFKRNKNRYRSIILSLTLSVLLFVSGNTFGTHLKEATDKSVVHSDYDICFYSKDMEEKEMFQLLNKLKHVSDISNSSYQVILPYYCTANTKDMSDLYLKSIDYNKSNETIDLPIDIQFIEDNIYLDFIESLGLSSEEYMEEKGKMIAAAKFKYKNQEEEGTTELVNIFNNPSMNLKISPNINNNIEKNHTKNINTTLVDVIPMDMLPRNIHDVVKSHTFIIVAPYSFQNKFHTLNTQKEIGLTFLSENPSKSVEEMEKIIKNSNIKSNYKLYNLYEVLEQNNNIIFIVDIFTYVFIIMISLIAIANVFNTISTNIQLRRRELAMLRSIGMSDMSFKKMMTFECIFYGLRTLLYSIPISGILSWLIYKSFILGGSNIKYILPWPSMLISIFSVFFIVFITMLYAVNKINKENIIDALRDDLN